MKGPAGRSDVARTVAQLGVLLLLAHGAGVLLGSPVRGLADNGDFWRVMVPSGLEPPPVEDRNRFIDPRPARRPAEGGFSSAVVLARVAALQGGDAVDLRAVGATYLVLVSMLFAFAIWAGTSPTICAFVAWVVVDPHYLLFFNSFYGDASAILGVLAVLAGLGALASPSRRIRGAAWTLIVLGVFFAAWSKQAHFVLGVVAALALLVARAPLRVARSIAAVCVVLSLGAGVHFGMGSGHRFPAINDFHAVFRGVAEVGSDPDETLRDLGIAAAHSSRVGTSYFDAPVPPDLAESLEGLSRPKLVGLYLSDPVAMGRAFGRVVEALTIQDRYLGNHSRAHSGEAARLYEDSWAFTDVRAALLRWVFVPLWLGALIWLLWRRRRADDRRFSPSEAALLFLWTVVAIEACTTVLGDGFFALWRHLVLARFALDLFLAVLLGLAVDMAITKWGIRSAGPSTEAEVGA